MSRAGFKPENERIMATYLKLQYCTLDPLATTAGCQVNYLPLKLFCSRHTNLVNIAPETLSHSFNNLSVNLTRVANVSWRVSCVDICGVHRLHAQRQQKLNGKRSKNRDAKNAAFSDKNLHFSRLNWLGSSLRYIFKLNDRKLCSFTVHKNGNDILMFSFELFKVYKV